MYDVDLKTIHSHIMITLYTVKIRVLPAKTRTSFVMVVLRIHYTQMCNHMLSIKLPKNT